MHAQPNSVSSKRVLTIGSALVDIFISSDQFQISHGEEEVFSTKSSGGKLSVDSFAIKTGGGGGNTAAGFAKLGFEVGCIAELGVDELAEIVVSDLRNHGVKTNYLIQERKEETGGSVLLVSGSGERTALVHRGAAAMLDPQDIDEAVVAKQDWIHLSSVAGRIATIQEIFKLAARHSIPLSWNPGHAELEVLAQTGAKDAEAVRSDEAFRSFIEVHTRNPHPVQVLFLNKEEWESIAVIHELLQAVVPLIVITDSVRGGIVLERIIEDNSQQGHVRSFSTKKHQYEAIQVQAVDNTGAGDAFAVGFVSARLHGHSLADSLKWATRNAASVVQKAGAKNGLLSLGEVNQEYNT